LGVSSGMGPNHTQGRHCPKAIPRFRELLHRPGVRHLSLFVAFLALLYFRRSAQLLNPQVWDEDGAKIIPGLLQHGLISLAYPVEGYLIVVPKIISAVSLWISGLYYPLVSTILAWIFTAWVCVRIAVSPIWLRGGPLLAVMTLLVPCDPEVFGVPLYTFWWATLLLFLVVLWKPESTDLKWRVSFTLLGGLSSPLIFIVAPFLIVRAIVWRHNRREWAVAGTALVCCALQIVAMLHADSTLARATMSTRNLQQILPKFVGGYFTGNFVRTTNHLMWIATAVFGAFVLLALPFLYRRPWYGCLMALWCGTLYLVARRVDLSILQARDAGPRYFFLPFVLLAWLLVSVLVESDQVPLKLFAVVLLFASLLNTWPVRSRPQSDFHWAEQVGRCAESDPFPLQISKNGRTSWVVPLNASECRALQRAGWIHLSLEPR
jgi:hypothetical protein